MSPGENFVANPIARHKSIKYLITSIIKITTTYPPIATSNLSPINTKAEEGSDSLPHHHFDGHLRHPNPYRCLPKSVAILKTLPSQTPFFLLASFPNDALGPFPEQHPSNGHRQRTPERGVCVDTGMGALEINIVSTCAPYSVEVPPLRRALRC